MQTNEASWDRILRIAVGIVLLSLTLVGPRTSWGLIGLLPVATGLWGFCPLYRVFGISTGAVRK